MDTVLNTVLNVDTDTYFNPFLKSTSIYTTKWITKNSIIMNSLQRHLY